MAVSLPISSSVIANSITCRHPAMMPFLVQSNPNGESTNTSPIPCLPVSWNRSSRCYISGIGRRVSNGPLNMPIVVLVLSTFAIWLIYWLVRMGGIDHVLGLFHRKSEEARRIVARESERIAALRGVDDPRDAATMLMLLIARAGGNPTREQIAAIESMVRGVFGFGGEL